MKVVKNEGINDHLFQQMIELDHQVWPASSETHLSTEYLYGLYQDTKDAMFFAVDDHGNLMGYQTIIFVDKKNFDEYYRTGDFMLLKNIGMHKGDNILYIYTANVKDEYQGSGCMKYIGQSIAQWLEEREKEGYHVSVAYAEAVSDSGVRTILQGFEMEAMDDVDENGLGHYILKDGMRAYRRKMLKK